MKSIDFTPDSYYAARRHKRDLMMRVATLGMLVVAMASALIGRYARTAAAREDLERLQASFEGQADVIASVGELQQRLGELERKRRLLADVAGGAPLHRILAELSERTPEAVALSAIRLTQHRRGVTWEEEGAAGGADPAGETDEGRLSISGWAASDRNVGNLMSNLARSPAFEAVALRYSRPVTVFGHEAKGFRITCRIPQFE